MSNQLEAQANWYAPAGEYCVDHTIIERNGEFHLFSISGTAGTSWYYSNSESRFSHSVSTDLSHWTFMGHVIPARGEMPPCPEMGIDEPWSENKVWAPHCIEAYGKYWMFYAGIQARQLSSGPDVYPWDDPNITSPGAERICLATSTDLVKWERHPTPVFAETAAMTSHPGAALRDPMVMPNPNGEGWLMYVTMFTEDMRNAVGALTSPDLLHWKFERFVYIEPQGSAIITESPFVSEFEGKYYVFVNAGYSVCEHPLGPFPACVPYEGEQPGWGAGENFLANGKLRRSLIGGAALIQSKGASWGGQLAVFDLEWTGSGFRYAPLSAL